MRDLKVPDLRQSPPQKARGFCPIRSTIPCQACLLVIGDSPANWLAKFVIHYCIGSYTKLRAFGSHQGILHGIVI